MKKRTNELLLFSIAEKLKQIRIAKGLTQEVVTDRTGVNIGLIELGKTNVSIVTLVILCNYYNVELEAFIKGIQYSRD